MRHTWGVILLFLLVMGGIYFGIFTPTESAGVGAMGAFLFALARRSLDLATLREVLLETGRTTAVMFTLLIGAILFSNFLNLSGMPQALAGWVGDSGLPNTAVILIIIGIYIVLGCVLESLSMMLLTVPVFYPIVQALGFDLIWFGIIIVVVIEISMITPPIGLTFTCCARCCRMYQPEPFFAVSLSSSLPISSGLRCWWPRQGSSCSYPIRCGSDR